MRIQSELLKEVATWARLRGKPRPKTEDGVKLLIAEFMASQDAVDARNTGGQSWSEVPDTRDTFIAWDGVKSEVVNPIGLEEARPFKDDWNEMLRIRNESQIGPNGEYLDDFDREWQVIEKTQANLKEQARWVRTNPTSLGRTPLGGVASVNANTSGRAQPITVAYWAGDEVETAPITCLFGAVNTPAIHVSGNKSRRPFGIIKFGTFGTLLTAEVDIISGCQLVVPASMVTLQVCMEQIPSGGAVTEAMNLTAMLSVNPVIRGNPVTKTSYIDGLGNGLTQIVTIPNFAQTFTVQRISSAGATSAMTVSVLDPDQRVLYAQTFAANALMTPNTALPLSGDAQYVKVLNSDGANAIDAEVIFSLGL